MFRSTTFIFLTSLSYAATAATSCRFADCPAGYKNTGVSCLRPAHTASFGSGRVADCPRGYTNMGATCYNWRKFKSLGMGSMRCRAGEFKSGARCYKNCPSGYTHTGISCYRGPKTLGSEHTKCRSNEYMPRSWAGFRCCKKPQRKCRKADCPAGYKNVKYGCSRPEHTISFGNGRVADCPRGYRNMGATCFNWRKFKSLGMGSMTCKAGEFKNGARCYKHCPAGYTHTGVSCYRGPKTIGPKNFICKSNESRLSDECCTQI